MRANNNRYMLVYIGTKNAIYEKVYLRYMYVWKDLKFGKMQKKNSL